MDIERVIAELLIERDRIQRIIESLDAIQRNTKLPAEPGAKRRGRKFMDRAAREEVSERMRRYWAERRAAETKARADHAPATEIGRGYAAASGKGTEPLSEPERVSKAG